MTILRKLAVLLTLASTTGCSGCEKAESDGGFPLLASWRGTLHYAVQAPGTTTQVVVAKRDTLYRLDAPSAPELFGSFGGAGDRHFLFDASSRALVLVHDGAKQALDFDLSALDDSQAPEPSDDAAFTLAPTGTRGKVLDYACDEYEGHKGEVHAKACVSAQDVPFVKLGHGFLPAQGAWAKPILDGKHWPLSVEMHRGEEVVFRAVLEKVETRAADTLFEIPKDYEHQSFLDALKRIKDKQERGE